METPNIGDPTLYHLLRVSIRMSILYALVGFEAGFKKKCFCFYINLLDNVLEVKVTILWEYNICKGISYSLK